MSSRVATGSLWFMIVVSLVMATACGKSTSEPSSAKESASSEQTAKPTETADADTEYRVDRQKAAQINVELGLGYLEQGQVSRAKNKLNQAIKLAPQLAETHSAMAHFLEMVGDYKDAEREHKKAANVSTTKGAVYNNYGAFLCRRGRFKEADQSFHTALQDKQYVRTAEIYENAGLCALKWPNLEKAAEYLSTAIRRDPHRSSAVLALVDLDLQQSKLMDAKALLNRFKTISEPTARSLWLGVQVARAEKDEDGVASQALLLKNLFEDSPEYQMYLKSEKNNL